jgi:hypothetical protein
MIYSSPISFSKMQNTVTYKDYIFAFLFDYSLDTPNWSKNENAH